MPIYQAEAKHDPIKFRDCVFDALVGVFPGVVNKTQNGVVIGGDRNAVSVLIEQREGLVTAYKVPYSLIQQKHLPKDATQACNENPDAGLFGTY